MLWAGFSVIRQRRWREAPMLLVPLFALGFLFLSVNRAQNGDWFRTGYTAYRDYAQTDDYAFSYDAKKQASYLHTVDPTYWLANIALFTMRFTFDYLGLPFLCVVGLISLATPRGRLFASTTISFCVVHSWYRSAGVDTFGPVHFTEMGIPAALLIALGLEKIGDFIQRFKLDTSVPSQNGGPGWIAILPSSMLGASVLFSALGYLPIRVGAILDISRQINAPRELSIRSRLDKAVVFSPFPFIPLQCHPRSMHFRHFRPNNDVELKNRVLWLNHLGLERDLLFGQQRFPSRDLYLLTWVKCQPTLMRISAGTRNGVNLSGPTSNITR
jgi:hypothetical protein